MELTGAVFHLVVMIGWCRNTRNSANAIGLCKFSRKFPLNENEVLQRCAHSGHTESTPTDKGLPSLESTVTWERELLNITSATPSFKSAFGQSRAEQSSPQISDEIGKTSAKTATTNEDSPSTLILIDISTYSTDDSTSAIDSRNHSSDSLAYSSDSLTYSSDSPAYSSDIPAFSSDTSTYSSDGPVYSPDTPTYSSDSPAYSSDSSTYSSDSSTFSSDSSTAIPDCPPNMIYTACGECESTCQRPNTCLIRCDSSEACVCPREHGFLLSEFYKCEHESTCGCFLQENGVIPEGALYISDDCSYQCFCQFDFLDCYPYLSCSDNGTCIIEQNAGTCYCNDGFEGNGESCSPMSALFTDCRDVYEAGYTQDGVYFISPMIWSDSSFDVYCNINIDGGGWTVFQRRVNGSTDFNKSWVEYREGFGDNRHGFWLGNEKLYHILRQGVYEVRIDFVVSVGVSSVSLHHKYASFKIDNEINNYQVIDRGPWHGGDGGAMFMVKNMNFSTYDRDNDRFIYSCSAMHGGGWWYGGVDWSFDYHGQNCKFWHDSTGMRSCTGSNPNGIYNGDDGRTIFLDPDFCSVQFLEMKIRRIDRTLP